MILEWKSPDQKNPLLVKFDMTEAEFRKIDVEDIKPENLKREFKLNEDASGLGMVFLRIKLAESARLVWAHLTNPKVLKEIKYPSGSIVKEFEAGVVEVTKEDEKVTVKVDEIHYIFDRTSIANPLVFNTKDAKTMVTELILDIINRPKSIGGDLADEQ